MKSKEFRILGSELGETDSFIDVTVDGIDEEGTLYFADVDSNRSWELTNREVTNLMNNNVMIGSDKVVTHKLWELATVIGTDRETVVTDDFAHENIEEAQRSAFLAAYFETR